MKRKYRLTHYRDFVQVRKNGKSIFHPLVVLVYRGNSLPYSRFGVAVSHHVGNAVQRNTIKRRLRACLNSVQYQVKPGWDFLLLARKPIINTSFQELAEAINLLFKKTDLSATTDLQE